MRAKLLIILSLSLGFFANSQTLDRENISGLWKTKAVHISNDVPQKEAVAMMEAAFLGATFNFQGNSIFYMEFGELADERMKELFKLNGENWKVADDRIVIGTEGNGFSTMHLRLKEEGGTTYFLLPMMVLEMEKIRDNKLTEPIKVEPESTSEIKDPPAVSFINRKIKEDEIVPFAVIENPPLAPKCKRKWDTPKQKECLSDYIITHVNRKFNTGLATETGVQGKMRIEVNFVIDTEGKVINITASGGPDIMNREAVNVIASLPQLEPGSIGEQTVNVAYTLPITFHVH